MQIQGLSKKLSTRPKQRFFPMPHQFSLQYSQYSCEKWLAHRVSLAVGRISSFQIRPNLQRQDICVLVEDFVGSLPTDICEFAENSHQLLSDKHNLDCGK